MLDRQPVAPFCWSEENRYDSQNRSNLEYSCVDPGFGDFKTGNGILFASNTANNNNQNTNTHLYRYHSAPSSLLDNLTPTPPHGSLSMGCMGPGPKFVPDHHEHSSILLRMGSCPARVDGWDDATSAHGSMLFNDPVFYSSTGAATTRGCGVSREKQFSLTSDLLLFDPVVLCRTRAKRGFATHPRSIAERVRRTKISDGIKKLQDLLPNIDKQASTADMLGEAIEYIKSLQQEKQELLERAFKHDGSCHICQLSISSHDPTLQSSRECTRKSGN